MDIEVIKTNPAIFRLGFCLTVLVLASGCPDSTGVRRRTWATRASLRDTSTNPTDDCLASVLDVRYHGIRTAQGRHNLVYFRSPVAHGGRGEHWIGAGFVRTATKIVLEFSEDWNGPALQRKEERALAFDLGGATEEVIKECLRGTAVRLDFACEAFPTSEPCPIPVKTW